MQDVNYTLIKCFAKRFEFVGKKILEVGAFVVPGQEKLMNIRPFFPGSDYLGCDMRRGKGVDKIEDAEHLSFRDGTFDLVICLDTFEHVKDPRKASGELYRVLKKNGVLILSSVMNFGIHEFPSDYWRFTPEIFRELTRSFSIQYIGIFGLPRFPQNIYAICAKGSPQGFDQGVKACLKDFSGSIRRATIRSKLIEIYYVLSEILLFRRVNFRRFSRPDRRRGN